MDKEDLGCVCVYVYVYIHTMEYYSGIEKNEIMPFATTWVDLETIILSEISQTEKDKSHMYHLYMESKIMIKNELIHIMEIDSQT